MSGAPTSLRLRRVRRLFADLYGADSTGEIERRIEKRLAAIEKTTRETWKSERLRHEAWLEVGRLDYSPAEIFLQLPSAKSLGRLRAAQKEPWTVEWIEGYLKEGETLYDIGANVGAYSLIAAKATGGAARIVAFEPSYSTFAALCENVILNDASEYIVPLQVTLTDSTRLETFHYSDRSAGAAFHVVGEASPAADSVAQPVLAYRLDDLLGLFDLPRPTHLKIDVDGGELRVLNGATETLAGDSVRSVMIEMNGTDAGPIEDILGAHAFELRAEHAPASKTGRPSADHSYGLFVRTS